MPNRAAIFNAKDVAVWADGVTPPVLQNKCVDAPNKQEDDETTEEPASTKHRGPVDSTAAVREMGEHKEDVPWSCLCPDAADQKLDHTSDWQIAQRKLEMMQEQALAIEEDYQLAQGLALDNSGRKSLVEHMRRTSRRSSHIDQRLMPAECGTGFANRSRANEDNNQRRNAAAWRRLGRNDSGI